MKIYGENEFDKLKIGDKIVIDFPGKGEIEATVVNIIKCTDEIILKTKEGVFFLVQKKQLNIIRYIL